MDKTEDSMALGGLEVRIEQRILFRLDLPNRKTVCVKAKPNKLTSEVLKPILQKYGYKLDLMSVHKAGEEKGVNLKCHVNEIDGHRLVVQTKEEVKEWGVEPARQKRRGGSNNNLDEITNRVFEDLLKGKAQQQQHFDELGVLDFDDRSSRTERSGSDRCIGAMKAPSGVKIVPSGVRLVPSGVKLAPSRVKPRLNGGVELDLVFRLRAKMLEEDLLTVPRGRGGGWMSPVPRQCSFGPRKEKYCQSQ